MQESTIWSLLNRVNLVRIREAKPKKDIATMASMKNLWRSKFKLCNGNPRRPKAHSFVDIVIYLFVTYLYSNFSGQLELKNSPISELVHRDADRLETQASPAARRTAELDDDTLERLDFLACLLKDHTAK